MVSITIASVLLSALAAPEPESATIAQDHSTPNAVVLGLYNVISGPAGKKRDPEQFRALFHESAKMVSVAGAQDGKVRYNVFTIEDYIERNFPFLENRGFFEMEVKNVTEEYGNVAHVFSTYESRWKKEDEEPFARGINSIQLMNDGERWWIMSIVWQSETPDIQLPAKYLPGG
ncbi:MAG: nuclear transport factor 2 family protein [Armatimonadetes bacterium]|nr:nuclear transport factor 2 family protein [Armatimonadota bacterium]